MQKPISLHTKKRNLSHSDCESVSCYDPAATLEMKKRLMFLSISLENLPCCIPHSPTPPPLTGLIHAHLHSNSLHQKISKETTTSVRRDLLRRFKKHSWWIFNKTGYLVQVGGFFFQHTKLCKGLICFQRSFKAALSCSSAEKQDKVFVVVAECDS